VQVDGGSIDLSRVAPTGYFTDDVVVLRDLAGQPCAAGARPRRSMPPAGATYDTIGRARQRLAISTEILDSDTRTDHADLDRHAGCERLLGSRPRAGRGQLAGGGPNAGS
jgi:hypothetical protein